MALRFIEASSKDERLETPTIRLEVAGGPCETTSTPVVPASRLSAANSTNMYRLKRGIGLSLPV
jgi:hypothetical protein